MKRQQLMEEVEKVIEDKHERNKVLEGLLGYILSTTQVSNLAQNFVYICRVVPRALENGFCVNV